MIYKIIYYCKVSTHSAIAYCVRVIIIDSICRYYALARVKIQANPPVIVSHCVMVKHYVSGAEFNALSMILDDKPLNSVVAICINDTNAALSESVDYYREVVYIFYISCIPVCAIVSSIYTFVRT